MHICGLGVFVWYKSSYYYFCLPGKTHGGSKITKENYETCLEVNPTLAGRHQ